MRNSQWHRYCDSQALNALHYWPMARPPTWQRRGAGRAQGLMEDFCRLADPYPVMVSPLSGQFPLLPEARELKDRSTRLAGSIQLLLGFHLLKLQIPTSQSTEASSMCSSF